jgi:hypothetical protein
VPRQALHGVEAPLEMHDGRSQATSGHAAECLESAEPPAQPQASVRQSAAVERSSRTQRGLAQAPGSPRGPLQLRLLHRHRGAASPRVFHQAAARASDRAPPNQASRGQLREARLKHVLEIGLRRARGEL